VNEKDILIQIKPGPDSIPSMEKILDLKTIYNEFGLDGMFVLYNAKKQAYYFYNKSLYNQPATPASTFNITTALIALEEGVCKDDNSIIQWNGYVSKNREANKDISLQFGFQHNIDWLFWELRKKIGAKKMKDWLSKLRYGNLATPSGMDSLKITPMGIDSFWVVSSTIRITPAQQLEYIKRLYYEQLPFSKDNIDIIKKLMYDKDIKGYKVYGKRGSYRLTGEGKYIGWYVGYLTKSDQVYFFVNYVQTDDLNHPKIVGSQKEIVFKILESYELPD